ncbi:MAG: TonB-dependent receptor [Bacteroidales bacterium]|nr:TonB-dependent receptor [Bacteroidales bacterium]
MNLHFYSARLLSVIIAFVCIGINVKLTHAQEQFEAADTLTSISIDGVVIIANRYENKIINSGASVSSLGAKDIRRLPANMLSNTLKFIPGVYMVSTDGMGLTPQVNVRGFYGGGEAEYLTLLVDGIPVNDLENGLASWNVMPLANLSSLEVLRGGSSALYGDAAMGGVLNLITDKPDKSFTNATFGYGNFNSFNIGVNHGGNAGKGFYELYANNEGTDGFREHSNWNSVTFGGKLKLFLGRNSTLAINSFNQLLQNDDPGPVSESQAASDRLLSTPYYREDGKDYKKFLLNADFRHKVNPTTDLSISMIYQHKNSKATTTYTQPPVILDMFTFTPIGVYDTTQFGNSKNRELTTDQAGFAVRLLTFDPQINTRITGGIEVDYGGFDNKVFDHYQGFENDYQNNYLKAENLEFAGDGFRFKSAAYLSGELPIFDDLKLIAGLRYDFISDAFSSNIPVADTSLDKSYNALSPKLALNLSTGETTNYKGSIFAGFSQAFKAPTIDQRTDLKSISAAVFFESGPTYSMMVIDGNPYSNADLKPQRSNNYELGTYQFYRFSEKFAAEISLTGYLIDVEDEIDFDLSEFKYRNIQSSRHNGLETSVNLLYKSNWRALINLNSSDVKFASGENEGKYLKGIPRLSHTLGITYAPDQGFGAGLSMNGASGIFLDDENTTKLDPYSIFSARLNYTFDFITVYFDVDNLFDKTYNSTGYLYYGTKYLYPAVGRFVRGGLIINI